MSGIKVANVSLFRTGCLKLVATKSCGRCATTINAELMLFRVTQAKVIEHAQCNFYRAFGREQAHEHF